MRIAVIATIAAVTGSGGTVEGKDSVPLTRKIDAIIVKAPFDRAIWGIVVEEEDGTILFERNRETLLVPASLRKLFTAIAVSSCASLESRISTEILRAGPVVDGVLMGDLIVRGAGDPSLGGRQLDSRDDALRPVLDALHAAAIRRIAGSVVADASMFADDPIPGGWKSDNLGEAWAAPAGALNYNENVAGLFIGPGDCADPPVTPDPWFPAVQSEISCGEGKVSWTVGPRNEILLGGFRSARNRGVETRLVAIADPGLYAAQAVTAFLRLNGIGIDFDPKVTQGPRDEGETLVTLESPPVYSLLATLLEESSNLYAEVLLTRISAAIEPRASRSAALELERRILRDEIGIGEDDISFEDGSGLSVEDLATPASILAAVRWMSWKERRAVWQELLPSPGEGTLKRRLKGLEGRVWAKTGSLDGVTGLAGWVITRNGELRRFVILINHHTQPPWRAWQTIDEILRIIAE